MNPTPEQALAALGLSGAAPSDAQAVQQAFERLARRYPQSHFPERFRQLLEARDRLLDTGRSWRTLLESSTLDLDWMLPHLPPPALPADRHAALQNLLLAGCLAEPIESGEPEDDGIPF